MVTIYSTDAKKFNNLGLAVLDDIVMINEVTEAINNLYNLKFTTVIDLEKKYEFIEAERILVVDTPDGRQPFRIKDVVKTNYTIEVFARHLGFDIENDLIEDTNIVGKNGAGAVNQIHTALKHNGKMFNFYSDIPEINNARMVRKYGMSALIGDDDNSFLSRWGGELYLTNKDIHMKQQRGRDRGFEILYKKNITGFNAKITTDHIGTKILVQGYDGLFLSDNPSERFVLSPLINNYANVYVKHLKFDNVKVKDITADEDAEGFDTIEEARAELRRLVNLEFANGLDKPKFTADVNFVLLQDTVEYANYAILERVNIGDIVTIKIPHLNINLKKRVLSYTYNSMTRKYISVTLGEELDDYNSDIKDEILGNIDDKFESTNINWENKFSNAVDEATDKINSGLGGFATKTRNEYLILDTEDINTAQTVGRWNLNGLGYSHTGYKGRYETCITSDGKFVINEVTANKFTGALLEAGTVKAESLTVESKAELREGLVTESEFIANNKEISASIVTATGDAQKAQEKADKAEVEALKAQEEADKAVVNSTKAQEQAELVKAKIDDISADDKLTPSEKIQLTKDLNIIEDEVIKITNEAVKFKVPTLAYNQKYEALNRYLIPFLSVMDSTDNIERTVFNKKHTDYYNGRQDILNLISTAQKKLADDAQAKANKAEADASAIKKTSETKFNIIDGQISTKVDVDGVKSTIQQNPSSVQIGFNGINNQFEVTKTEVNLRNTAGKRHMSLKNGGMSLYKESTSPNGVELGRYGMNTWINTSNWGLHTGLSSGGYYAISKLSGTNYLARMYFNYGAIPDTAEGIHLGANMNCHTWDIVNSELKWDCKAHDAGEDDTAGIYCTYNVTDRINTLLTFVGSDNNDNMKWCCKSSASLTTVMMIDKDWNHMYNPLDMHYWAIKNIGTSTFQDIKIADESAFFGLNTLEKKVTSSLTKNTEWLHKVNTVDGVAIVELPIGIAFTDYSVFLSVIGRNNAYLMEQNENYFRIETDKDCEVKILVKFENDISHYNKYIEGEKGEIIPYEPKEGKECIIPMDEYKPIAPKVDMPLQSYDCDLYNIYK